LFLFQDSISFKEVVIYFTKEEWALLDPDQKALHEEIMLETCRNVAFLSKMVIDDGPMPCRYLPSFSRCDCCSLLGKIRVL
uniref:KRAB domain-containing protein n=1 Tax=Laticauda laticaudata TaxID=8630 RepID=A0A8C5S987_LATLA